MSELLPVALVVVVGVFGLTLVRHRRELIQLRQMIASLDARMGTQSERIAAVESEKSHVEAVPN